MKYRCDYCGGHLWRIAYRYYRMRFCCKAHMSAYKQRFTMPSVFTTRESNPWAEDPLLEQLRAVHGRPRPDLYPGTEPE